jgi:hypothetical protein
MMRKWFEHSGCIDLAKIPEYIYAYDTFEREVRDISTQHIEWQLSHRDKCTADRGSCDCPPELEGPVAPTLQDYKTEEAEACPIGDVLRHPYVGRLPTKILVLGLSGPSYLVVPEQESSEAERRRAGLELRQRFIRQDDISSLVNEYEESIVRNSVPKGTASRRV